MSEERISRYTKKNEHMKPQESYIAMISSAILSTPDKRMTLSEINEYLMKNYECFQGEYQGWKNSVRHNLSFNKCFVKILRDPGRSWGKNNYWGVVVSLLQDYLKEDGKFRRRRKRQAVSASKKYGQPTEFRPVCLTGPRNMAQVNYESHFSMHPQVLCSQDRGVVTLGGEYNNPLHRYRNTFSIDRILQSSSQMNRQPISCLPAGWIELKNTNISKYKTLINLVRGPYCKLPNLN